MPKPLVKNIALSVAALIFSLLAAEIAITLFSPAPKFQSIDINSSGGAYALSPNKKLIYVPRPNTGLFNAYGHRGIEHPLQKGDKTRIVFMGDSVVEGLKVADKSRFTEILNDYFRDKGYEFINLGVCGYSFLQEVEYLKVFGIKFHPDRVVFGITYNDLRLYSGEMAHFDINEQIRRQKGLYSAYYAAGSRLNNLLSFSNIYRYLRYSFLAHSKKGFHSLVYYKLDNRQIEKLLTELQNLSKTYNFKVTFIFLPINTSDCVDEIKGFEQIIRARGIECVNLNNSLQDAQLKKLFFFRNDPCHLNSAGHKAVAYMIERYRNLYRDN